MIELLIIHPEALGISSAQPCFKFLINFLEINIKFKQKMIYIRGFAFSKTKPKLVLITAWRKYERR